MEYVFDSDIDFSLSDAEVALNNQCLSFWRMTQANADLDHGVVLSYWLEGGAVHCSGIPNREEVTIPLRDNPLLTNPADRRSLKSLEPIDPHKLGLIGLRLGVLGDKNTAPWTSTMYLSEVVVSPQGFVFKRDTGVPRSVDVSDVRTLAQATEDPFGIGEPDYESEFWQLYHLDDDPDVDILHEVVFDSPEQRSTQMGNGVLPKISGSSDKLFTVSSLAAWAEKLMRPITDSDNDPLDAFSPEAAAFVHRYLGFNVTDMDMQSANMARAINAAYSNPAKPERAIPYNPAEALDALQKAVVAANEARIPGHPISPAARWAQGRSVGGAVERPPDKPAH